MSDDQIAMFDGKGRGTPFQLARWKNKGGTVPLQPEAVLIEAEGVATVYYRSTWAHAFPTRAALPMEPVARRDGKFTDEMLAVWL